MTLITIRIKKHEYLSALPTHESSEGKQVLLPQIYAAHLAWRKCRSFQRNVLLLRHSTDLFAIVPVLNLFYFKLFKAYIWNTAIMHLEQARVISNAQSIHNLPLRHTSRLDTWVKVPCTFWSILAADTPQTFPWHRSSLSPKQKQPKKANKYEHFVATTFVFGRQLMH